MSGYKLTEELLSAYDQYLQNEERSKGTIEKYLRDLRAFSSWLRDKIVTKDTVTAWKEYLLSNHYAPVTINSMLAALNGMFRFARWDIRAKFLKIQRRTFREKSREMNRSDYEKLIAMANSKNRKRLSLLIETICSTGIRVSEVKYITVEAAKCGRADISLKGKIRTILIPKKLCSKLLSYAKKQKTASGEIFLTRTGKGMSRQQIWSEMKRLCKNTDVELTKVFPHNLRHLFAVTFHRVYQDVVLLADILGHSSIETTRIYLLTSAEEHMQRLDQLGLVI